MAVGGVTVNDQYFAAVTSESKQLSSDVLDGIMGLAFPELSALHNASIRYHAIVSCLTMSLPGPVLLHCYLTERRLRQRVRVQARPDWLGALHRRHERVSVHRRHRVPPDRGRQRLLDAR